MNGFAWCVCACVHKRAFLNSFILFSPPSHLISLHTMPSKLLSKAVKNKQEGGKFWKPGQPKAQETASKQSQKHDAIDDSNSTPKSPKLLSKGVMSMKVELMLVVVSVVHLDYFVNIKSLLIFNNIVLVCLFSSWREK